MLQSGLINEAEYLFKSYDSSLKPLNSIGLKECKEYLDSQIDIDELKNLIIVHTTQLAKRQRTFNKGFDSIKIDAKNLNPNQFISQIKELNPIN